MFFALLGGLLQVSNDVSTLRLLLESREGHLGTRDVLLGVLQVGKQRVLVPHNSGLFVGISVAIASNAATLATKQAMQSGTSLCTTFLLNDVALQATCLEQLGTILGITSGDPSIKMEWI